MNKSLRECLSAIPTLEAVQADYCLVQIIFFHIWQAVCVCLSSIAENASQKYINLPAEYEKNHCAKHLVCKKRTWPMFPEYRSHASSLTYRCCSPNGRIFYKFNITLSLTLIKPCTIWGQISTHLEHEIQMFHISQLFYPIFFLKVILAQLDFKEKSANILKHKSTTQTMVT